MSTTVVNANGRVDGGSYTAAGWLLNHRVDSNRNRAAGQVPASSDNPALRAATAAAMAAAAGEPPQPPTVPAHYHWLARLPPMFWSRMHHYLDYAEILNLSLLSSDFRAVQVETYLPWHVRHAAVARHDNEAAIFAPRGGDAVGDRGGSNGGGGRGGSISGGRGNRGRRKRNNANGRATVANRGSSASVSTTLVGPLLPPPPPPPPRQRPQEGLRQLGCYLCFRMRNIDRFPRPEGAVQYARVLKRDMYTGRRTLQLVDPPWPGDAVYYRNVVHPPPPPVLPSVFPPGLVSPSSLHHSYGPRLPTTRTPAATALWRPSAPGAEPGRIESLRRYCIDCALDTELAMPGDVVVTMEEQQLWVCNCRQTRVMDSQRCPSCGMSPVYRN
ncbi:hypothetical protein SPI_04365 [Niveomyces insectorum RCEF 264]|uniref:F-box domain-containing protein n=1 Tax=Niveomyces insectorum RCEF 264 TaxID=1081102 RepID=A0A167VNQ7_9HYPO|nr:hypothetical protein SPI_04365 [Niveomyces insectorum RCEF 264]